MKHIKQKKHEFVGNYQFNVAEMTYVYICRGSDGKIMCRCESVKDARLIAGLLNAHTSGKEECSNR